MPVDKAEDGATRDRNPCARARSARSHDERFFVYLKDQLVEKDWQFLRITRLDADFGPRFTDHKVTAQMIEQRWANGESAANEIRQAEEEWLLACCREFGVDVRIRTVDRALSATAFAP